MTEEKNTYEAPKNTPEVINLEKQDFRQFTNLEKNTTKNILAGTRLDIADENEQDISKEFGEYVETLSKNTDWATKVLPLNETNETNEINEQEKIANILSLGAMLPIADVVEANVENNTKTTTENLTISSLLTNPVTHTEKYPNIKKNLELLQTLHNIQNPPADSIAHLVQKNWTTYAQAIQEYSENYLAQKNEFQWTKNTTGKTVAGATALQQIFYGKKSLPEALLTAAITGTVSATAHNYFDDDESKRSIKTATKETVGDFFTGTKDILNTGTKFLADYYKNPENSNTEKTVMTGLGIAGTLFTALKGGDVLRGIGNSAKNMFSTDKKNSDSKENSESFFSKHWGKLGLGAGAIALIIHFLPKDLGDRLKEWFNTLKDITTPDRNTKNLGVGGALINSAEHAIDNTVRDHAEVANTAGMEVKDYKFSNEDIQSFQNIFTEFSHSENKPLADKANEIIEEMKSEDVNRTGIVAYIMSFFHLNIEKEEDTYIPSNRFGELSQLAQAAGYDISIKENTDKTFSLTIKKDEKVYTINNLEKDVIEHNIAITHSSEQQEIYREKTKIKFIQTGMDNLLAFIPTVRNEEDSNVKMVLNIAQQIKTSVDQNGSKGFTQELYQNLNNAITKINAKIISTKNNAEIILQMNENNKNSKIENFFIPDISLGIPPNISNEALDENKDLIQKNSAESILEGFRQFENRVVIETLEAMINDEDIKENSAVFQVLTKYRNRGDAFVNPIFFYEMYTAIEEDNDGAIAMVIDGAKFSFILGGKVITAGLAEDAAQLLKGIYNQDSDKIAQGAGTLVFIGSVKLADTLFNTVPGMKAGRVITFIPSKILYDLPVYTVKSLLHVNALTFQARHAKLIAERKMAALKNVSPAFRLSKKLDKFVRKIEILTAEKELYKGVVGKGKRVKEIENILNSEPLKKEWEVLQKNLSNTIDANPKYFKNIRKKYSNITQGNVSSFSQFKDFKFEKVVDMIETNNPLIKNIKLQKTTNLRSVVNHSRLGTKNPISGISPEQRAKLKTHIDKVSNSLNKNIDKSKFTQGVLQSAQILGYAFTVKSLYDIGHAKDKQEALAIASANASIIGIGMGFDKALKLRHPIAVALSTIVLVAWGDDIGEFVGEKEESLSAWMDKNEYSEEYYNTTEKIGSAIQMITSFSKPEYVQKNSIKDNIYEAYSNLDIHKGINAEEYFQNQSVEIITEEKINDWNKYVSQEPKNIQQEIDTLEHKFPASFIQRKQIHARKTFTKEYLPLKEKGITRSESEEKRFEEMRNELGTLEMFDSALGRLIRIDDLKDKKSIIENEKIDAPWKFSEYQKLFQSMQKLPGKKSSLKEYRKKNELTGTDFKNIEHFLETVLLTKRMRNWNSESGIFSANNITNEAKNDEFVQKEMNQTQAFLNGYLNELQADEDFQSNILLNSTIQELLHKIKRIDNPTEFQKKLKDDGYILR